MTVTNIPLCGGSDAEFKRHSLRYLLLEAQSAQTEQSQAHRR
jgi:hypothetical protein